MPPDRPLLAPSAATRAVLALALLWSAVSQPHPALAGPAGGQGRRLGCGLGTSLGAFNSCPTFSLWAAFPIRDRLAAEAEFSYAFNPADEESDQPPGYHRSSAGLGLTVAGTAALGSAARRAKPYLGAGAGWIYLSTLTDRPPAGREALSRNRLTVSIFGGLLLRMSAGFGLRFEPRLILLSGGEGVVLRLSAGAFAVF